MNLDGSETVSSVLSRFPSGQQTGTETWWRQLQLREADVTTLRGRKSAR